MALAVCVLRVEGGPGGGDVNHSQTAIALVVLVIILTALGAFTSSVEVTSKRFCQSIGQILLPTVSLIQYQSASEVAGTVDPVLYYSGAESGGAKVHVWESKTTLRLGPGAVPSSIVSR